MDIFIKGLNDMKKDLEAEMKKLTDKYGESGMIVREKIRQLESIETMYRTYKEGGMI